MVNDSVFCCNKRITKNETFFNEATSNSYKTEGGSFMHRENKRMQKKIEDELMQSYEMMYRIAYSFVYDEEDAMDIVQESAYKSIYNAFKVKNEKYIKTWICKIVMNTAMDCLRKRKKEIPVDKLYEMDEPMEPSLYLHLDMQTAIQSLSERERAVIILRYFEEKRFEDIAIIMNMNINTVKSMLYRSLKKMEVKLTEGEMRYEG